MVARRTTIEDVAAEAGVSAATVSNALAGTGRVSARTREHVQSVAARLDYQPSRAARGLRLKRHGAIGLLLPVAFAESEQYLDADYYTRLVSSAAIASFGYAHGLTVLPGEGPGVVDFVASGTDGVLVLDPTSDDPRLQAFNERNIPVVTIERDLTLASDPWWVGSDHPANTNTMLEHLHAGDARRVGLLLLDRPWSWTVETEQAYEEWSSAHGVEPRVLRTNSDGSDGLDAIVDELLDDVDAIVAATDHFAVRVVQRALARGLRVPGDLQVVAAVDGLGSRHSRPEITAFDLRPSDQARVAVDLLMQRIEGSSPAQPKIVPGALQVRQSTRIGAAESDQH